MDTEVSTHTELNKDQDKVATDDTKEPKDLDLDPSFLTEVPEDHEVPGTGDIYEGNTQKNSDYDTTMDLDVANIDKMIIIHGGPCTRQLIKFTL